MIIKSFVVIEEDGYFLLIREAAKKWRGKWFLPGGKTKLGENPKDTAVREVKEEAGCEVKIKGIFYIRYHERLFNKQLSIFHCASMVSEKIKTKADKHSLEVKWFTYSEIKTLATRQKLPEVLMNYIPRKVMPPENFKLYF